MQISRWVMRSFLLTTGNSFLMDYSTIKYQPTQPAHDALDMSPYGFTLHNAIILVTD